jgi:hypothetical protein
MYLFTFVEFQCRKWKQILIVVDAFTVSMAYIVNQIAAKGVCNRSVRWAYRLFYNQAQTLKRILARYAYSNLLRIQVRFLQGSNIEYQRIVSFPASYGRRLVMVEHDTVIA